jgi:hypothetical protein
MRNLSNQFLTHWINFWVFVFCVTVLAVNGHGGEAAIILLLTMAYIFEKLNFNEFNHFFHPSFIVW